MKFVVTGGEKMSLPTSAIVLAIIALLVLVGGLVSKFRWLVLISIFLFLMAAWMVIGEFLTDMEF